MKQASHIYSRSMEKKNRRDSAAFPVRPKKEWDTGRKKLTHKTTLFVSFTRVCIYPRIYLSMRVCICVRVCMYVSFACIYICIYIYRDISSKNISSKLATIKISRKLANACVSRYICVCICICACVLCVYMYNNFRFHLVPLICYFAIYTNRQMENLASTRGVEIKTSCRIKKETAFVLYSVLGVRRPFS